MTSSITWTIRHELPTDAAGIEVMQDHAFGPARFTRTAFQVRQGVEPDTSLCLVGEADGVLAGSVKMTPIMIGATPSMLLGPLTVDTPFKGKGLGGLLLRSVAEKAKAQGVGSILLVGDQPYYGPHGYVQVPHGQITLPGPVDPNRLLILLLNDKVIPTGQVQGGLRVSVEQPALGETAQEPVVFGGLMGAQGQLAPS